MLERSTARSGEIGAGYLAELRDVLATISEDALGRAIDRLLEARAKGQRVYIFGNGGSAATASHLVCDLMKTAYVPPFSALRAYAVMDNLPVLTARSNDDAYERAVSGQLAALLEPGDVVIAISASGNSPNVIEALQEAHRSGATTIGLFGFDGGAGLTLVDIPVLVPVRHYGLAEDAHAAIGHAMTRAIRTVLEDELAATSSPA